MLRDIKDDSDFAQRLLAEENLFLLPGQCFGMSGYVRIVTCPPKEIISEAFVRIQRFIKSHRLTTDNGKRIRDSDTDVSMPISDKNNQWKNKVAVDNSYDAKRQKV